MVFDDRLPRGNIFCCKPAIKSYPQFDEDENQTIFEFPSGVNLMWKNKVAMKTFLVKVGSYKGLVQFPNHVFFLTSNT